MGHWTCEADSGEEGEEEWVVILVLRGDEYDEYDGNGIRKRR